MNVHMIRKSLSTSAVIFVGLLAISLSTGCNKTVDDATLLTNVKAALAADNVISRQQIQTAVQNGVVTLSGNVTDDTASALAAEDAAKVKGVKEVVNDMRIAGVQVAPTVVTPSAPKVARQTTTQERTAIARHEALPPPPPAPSQAPPPPPEPTYRDVTVPAGREIPVRITQTLDSETTEEGSTFTGVVTREVVADGLVVIPAGSGVSGSVVVAHEAGHFKGHSLLSIQLTSLNRHGRPVSISTDSYTVEGKNRGTNSAAKIGGGAAVGALLGGIFGGGRGAAIGAAAGGGGGAAYQGLTRGQQVSIPSETVVRFTLANSFTVRTSEQPSNYEPLAEPTLQPRQ